MVRRATTQELIRTKVRKISSLAERGDVVTMAALGLVFASHVPPSVRDESEVGSDRVGDDLHARQSRLDGVPGVGLSSHLQAVGVRTRGDTWSGRLI